MLIAIIFVIIHADILVGPQLSLRLTNLLISTSCPDIIYFLAAFIYIHVSTFMYCARNWRRCSFGNFICIMLAIYVTSDFGFLMVNILLGELLFALCFFPFVILALICLALHIVYWLVQIAQISYIATAVILLALLALSLHRLKNYLQLLMGKKSVLVRKKSYRKL